MSTRNRPRAMVACPHIVEYPDMCFTFLGEFSVLTKNDTVHLTIASGFPHKQLADVVVSVSRLIALF